MAQRFATLAPVHPVPLPTPDRHFARPLRLFPSLAGPSDVPGVYVLRRLVFFPSLQKPRDIATTTKHFSRFRGRLLSALVSRPQKRARA